MNRGTLDLGYITHTHGNIQIATSEIQGRYHAI